MSSPRPHGVLGQVQVHPFDRVNKFFADADHGSRPAATKVARAWELAIKADLKEQRKVMQTARPEISTLKLADVITRYLSDPDTKLLRSYSDVHRLLCWWKDSYGQTRARECSNVVWFEARDRLYFGRVLRADEDCDPVLGPGTVNRYLGSMRSCWNWSRDAGFVDTRQRWPESNLMLTEPAARSRFLDDAELSRLLAIAKEHGAVMHAAILVSIATGLRQGELLRLNWADVDMAKKLLCVNLSKNGERRTVHLPESACEALRTLQGAKVRALGPVFILDSGDRMQKSTLESRWYAVRSAAKLKDFRWHDLRHSCASILAQEGATLMQIGSQLGHKSPSVTMKYAHLVQGKQLPAHVELDKKLRGAS